jgi:hypothetical protein
MACSSLVSLPITCGSEGIIAGVSKLYMVAVQDLKPVTGSALPYTLATNKIVSTIGLQTAKKFVEIGLIKNTSGINETGVFNDNGTNYSTISLTLQLLGITAENQAFVASVKGQEVAAIALDKSGVYYTIGLNGGLKVSALTGGLGVTDSDQKGYSLSFTGNDVFGIKIIETSAAIAAIGATVPAP